jgi:hypothetical protein
LSTVGLGAVISHATDTGNFRVLLAATIVMAAMVVTLNRLIWRRLYGLASTNQAGNLKSPQFHFARMFRYRWFHYAGGLGLGGSPPAHVRKL